MKHIAVACCLAWGHARSVCCLVASLINADEDVTITLIMAALGAELCKTELKRCGVLDSAHLRIITVGKTSGYEEVLQPFLEMPSLIIPVLDTLVAEAAVGEYEALRRPTMLISDHYLYEATDHGKRLGMSTWTYSTGSPGAIYQCLSLDKDEVPEVLVAEGQPTLYSYEIQPSSWPGEGESPLTAIRKAGSERVFGHVHNKLFSFSRELDAEAATSADALYAGPSTKALVVGPQYSSTFWRASSSAGDSLTSTLDESIAAFLSTAQARHGRNSVLYISFGSYFFPSSHPWQVEQLVESLIVADFPFIFVMAATLSAQLPEAGELLKQRITSSGNFVTGWIDQETTLRHPAIGYVLSHSGYNTIIESLINGLPLVLWPFSAEQGSNCAWLAEQLDVAIQLFQPRDKLVGKKLYGRDVVVTCTLTSVRAELDETWRAFRGEEGARKRKNARRAGEVLRREHAEKSEGYLKGLLSYV